MLFYVYSNVNVINSLSQTRYINHCKAFQRGSYILEYIGVHSKRAVCSSTTKESFWRESEVTFSYSYTSHDFSVTKKYSLARKKHCKGIFTFCLIFYYVLLPSRPQP